MNKGQEFANRKKFIEGTITDFLKVKEDFEYLKYARRDLTESEYIRIGDVQGRAITLDITAMSLEEIIENISRLILVNKEKVNPPANIVSDPAILRAISKYFK